MDGLVEKDFAVAELEENVWVSTSNFTDVEVYQGFEFDQIKSDLFGNSRSLIVDYIALKVDPINGIMTENRHPISFFIVDYIVGN